MSSTNLQEILAQARRTQEDRPVRSLLHLLLPLGLLVSAIVLLALTGRLGTVATAAGVSFFTLGKLIILSGALPDFPLTTEELALMVIFMDCLYAYFLAYNLHHLYRVPRVGPWLERLQNYCHYWLAKNPWMRRWAFTGVMLFVLFPLTGTGAPGGSILGRLVGLSARTTLMAIAVGSVLGCTLMAAFAVPLEKVFHDIQHEWWFEAIGLLVLAMLILLLYRLGRRLSRAAQRYADSQGQGGDA